MPTLQELHLDNNLFIGAIELSSPSSSETNLHILDLSHNQINGYFPDQFGSLTALQVLSIAGNNFSGSLPTSVTDMSSLRSLEISQNHFAGPLPNNFPDSLENFNASYNDLTGLVPENLRKFPRSSFYPGNRGLHLPSDSPGSSSSSAVNSKRKPLNTLVKVIIIVSRVVAVVILLLLIVFIHYIRISRKLPPEHSMNKDIHKRTQPNPSVIHGTETGGATVVSAEDLLASRKGTSSEIISPDEKMAAVTGFSPSKHTHLSWSPESGDSFHAENLSRLDVRLPDRLVGELYFLCWVKTLENRTLKPHFAEKNDEGNF